ncbi:MAG: glutamine--tRNA ligase/YqeY domain fusion protein [Bryobacteraceae bacterium]
MTRVRFAPSPTGYLHIGGARTFIFNWLYARHYGGVIVLRIDDTDVERNTQISLESIYEGLEWLELGWDELYHQSDRVVLHRQAAWAIFEKGLAYRDFTPASMALENSNEGWLSNPGMRELSREESNRRAKAGEPFVLRFRVPRESRTEIVVPDLVYGTVTKATSELEDFALLRSTGMPTYHMASCADDADLRITDILRGQEHLANTFKHVLIFEALGVEMPKTAHLPLLMAPDGAKLSKRKHGPVVSVTTYRDAGFLPHAFVNFLCLLGWSPKNDREKMSREELVKLFSIEGINRANAIINFTDEDPFDPKAVWLNAEHLHTLDLDELAQRLMPYAQQAGFTNATPEKLRAIAPLIRERIRLLRDVGTVADFLFSAELTPYDPAELIPQKGDAAMAALALHKARDVLAAVPAFDHGTLEPALRGAADELKLKAGQMFQPIRVAVCGRKNAPPLFETLQVLGRDTVLTRIDSALGLSMNDTDLPPSNFIRDIILSHNASGKYGGRVRTRFPPEPNGYLHVGHAKSIILNFGLAEEFGGECNLRFDDTNPAKEETEYVESIIEDVKWLGGDFGDRLFYASDYFPQLYLWAVDLIKKGKAYVCDLSSEQVREMRGTLTEAGQNSPYRDRSVEENLDLFARMKNGEFPDGARTLRAKIDMASPNLNMRDPVMYRILHAGHHRTANQWCIYPMYDWAHGQCDSIEGITHSICTLEFEDHRPLYDWFLEQLGVFHPQQIEFDRLNLTYTVLSKRKLLQLVEQGMVEGWDDPRMPTISGMRRRGYSPEGLRNFARSLGISKTNGTTELEKLEYYIREDLNKTALRVMTILRPLKLVLTNYPEDQVEFMDAINNPEDASAGTRQVPFSRELWIEQEDFRELPPKGYHRLYPGNEVRLRYGYIIKCHDVVKDSSTGEVTEIHCTYDPQTRSGQQTRKVKSTIHWVSAAEAIPIEVRLYDKLFTVENPNNFPEDADFTMHLNPKSLEVVQGKAEPSLAKAEPGDRYQFERLGYFCADTFSKAERLVFNRTVELRDTWAKLQKK